MNFLANILLKTSSVLRRIGKRISEDKEWTALLKKWNKLDKEKQYRTNYPDLERDSVVFDLGGYKGQWASDIYARYQCKIHVFEPHPYFVLKINERFEKNEDIKVFDFGLGDGNEQLMMSSREDSSSTFGKGEDQVEVNLIEAEEYMNNNNIEWIDLMKINIEGGEYKLLDHLITTNRIKKIKNIQVQFHHFVPNAEQLMSNLHKKLARTHQTTYSYRFFWENWKLKEEGN